MLTPCYRHLGATLPNSPVLFSCCRCWCFLLGWFRQPRCRMHSHISRVSVGYTARRCCRKSSNQRPHAAAATCGWCRHGYWFTLRRNSRTRTDGKNKKICGSFFWTSGLAGGQSVIALLLLDRKKNEICLPWLHCQQFREVAKEILMANKGITWMS